MWPTPNPLSVSVLSEQTASPDVVPLPLFMAAYSHVCYPALHQVMAEGSVSSLSPFKLLHTSTVPIVVIYLNGRLLDCNDACAAFLSHTREGLLHPRSTFFDYTQPVLLILLSAILCGLIENPEQTERALKT